jgi:SulP family sulfate permease
LHSRGKQMVLSGPHSQPMFMMAKAGFVDRLGEENFCADIDLALARARAILNAPRQP